MGRLAHVAGAGAYERAALVLLDGVPDPTDGPPQSEEGHSAPRRQAERPRQDNQPEVDGGPFADQVKGLFKIACKQAGIANQGPRLSIEHFRKPIAGQLQLFD